MSSFRQMIVRSPLRASPPTALRAWWLWVVLAGIILTTTIVLLVTQVPPESGAAVATVSVVSVPPGAMIEVDGHERGRAPTSVMIKPGEHHIRLQREGYFDADYRLALDPGQDASLEVELWLRSPEVQRLRPAFPGASIAQAGFLADGRVALTVALPPSDERQLWLMDSRGQIGRFGPPETRGAVAVSPDGLQVAYVKQGQNQGVPSGAAEARFDEVWVSERDGESGERRYALPPKARDQGLLDLGWAPVGNNLLVAVYHRLSGGGQHTRLLWLDLSRGSARDLISLPSDIVPGSYHWKEDGQTVAFLTRAGQLTSLCLLSTTGEFRYLADLSRDAWFAAAFPPLSWSPDGHQLVYAAPPQDHLNQTGWLFGPKPTTDLSIADASGAGAKRLGTAEGQFPIWRRDGLIFALTRPKSDGPLVLRSVDSDGSSRDLGPLPVQPASSYSAQWDSVHAQALIVSLASNTLGPAQPEYWLVRFRPEVGQ